MKRPVRLLTVSVVAVLLGSTVFLRARGDDHRSRPRIDPAVDPGVRGGDPGAGDPLDGLLAGELTFFEHGQDDFGEADGTDEGLGPRFNGDGCGTCHAHPAVGGASPFINPQTLMPDLLQGNRLPSFITADGPVREVRFPLNRDGTPDGGVHALFVITGREDADECDAVQEDFEAQVRRRNIIFRVPTGVFGLGLVEMIPDSAIRDNLASSNSRGRGLGIHGHANRISGQANHNGNDGTIARFGWKAQNKSLLLFAAEAYNVEMGISNELFPTERDENPNCQSLPVPNAVTHTENTGSGPTITSNIENFAMFMRFLAPPSPVTSDFITTTAHEVTAESTDKGRTLFSSTGCALCHTPAFVTGNATVAALSNKEVPLYSDLAVHGMGPKLADDVSQGEAGGDEFRTALLWGLGQRVFFLHDGRTSDLLRAIQEHSSEGNRQYRASEANGVIDRFNRLSEAQKQDLLNFLRSL